MEQPESDPLKEELPERDQSEASDSLTEENDLLDP